MLTIEQKRRAVGVLVFLLPGTLVILVNALLGTPASVQADEAQDPLAAVMPALPTSSAPNWSVRTIAAAHYAATLRGKSFGQTPIYYPVPVPQVPAGPDSAPTAPGAPPEFRPDVQLIMDSPRGALAIISGHMYHVGEMIRGTTWEIDGIDASNRTITFRNDEAERTLTIKLGPPV